MGFREFNCWATTGSNERADVCSAKSGLQGGRRLPGVTIFLAIFILLFYFAPASAASITGVQKVAAGGYHTVALKSDGTVWTLGYNKYGQLGDATITDRTTAVQVSGLNGVTAVAAGLYHTVALRSDGTVWTWGRNVNGQLGNGTTTQSTIPVQVSGLSGITSVAAGYGHTVALKSDGTVWTWGYNLYGQLGNGTTTQSTIPVQVSGLSGITAIAAGYYHTVALMSNGTVLTCGYNLYGQLGDGTKTNRSTPVVVSGLSGVSAVAAGFGHTVALLNGGTAKAWGYNFYGQLGDGTTTDKATPVTVNGLSGVTAVAAGLYNSAVLKSDNTVWGWGYNVYGQLGDGTMADKATPVQVSGLSGATAVAAGLFHVVALKNDDTVWAWGYNLYGQLGDGTATDWTAPAEVSGLSGVAVVGAGGYHSVALKSDGTVWGWGHNVYGQLGDGTTTDKTTPVAVSGLSGVTDVAAGGYHTVALKGDGTVWTWGRNTNGQLGDGTTAQSTTPVEVVGLSGVTAVATGLYHTVALKSDGTVWAWGSNSNGQLGDGTTTQSTTPVWVSGLSGVAAVAAGGYHTAALKSDGTVWIWGLNSNGQLGDGTTTQSATPVWVSGLSGVTTIATGLYHTAAVKSDSTVWDWGYNFYGQLGNAESASHAYPQVVNNRRPEPTAPPISILTDTQGSSQVTPNDADISDTHNYAIMTVPSHGALSIDAAGLSTYTPDAGYSGNDIFFVSVTDNSGGIGYVSIAVTITASVYDTIPVQFSFTDQTEVALNTVINSNSIVVQGINSPAGISIALCTGGPCEYSINGGLWTTAAGIVNNGDTVQVRQTSSSSFFATTFLTLNIGGVTDTFSVRTIAGQPSASFYWSPDTSLSYKVNFSAVGSVCVPGHSCTYAWDFGDTSTGSGVVTAHMYSASVSYSVTLRVTDVSTGSYSVLTQAVIPAVVNAAPVVSRIGSNPVTQLTVAGYTVSFTDTSTDDIDPQGSLEASVLWGDGTVTTGAAGQSFSHTYGTSGSFVLKHYVTDTGGLKSRWQNGTGWDAKVTVPTSSTKYTISGTITVTVNGSGPLANVTVVLKKNGVTLTSTKTNAGGVYFFTGLNGGTTYTVTATLNGYDWQTAAGTQSLSVPVSVSVGSADAIQDFHAAKSPATL